MKRVQEEVVSSGRKRSLRTGVVSALLSGAMAVGALGAVFAPGVTGAPAGAHSAAVRTVAYSTPLESARPAGIAKAAAAGSGEGDDSGGADGSGSSSSCVQGGGLTICGKPASSSSSSSSGGTTKAASTKSSTGSSGDSDDLFTKFLSPLLKAFSDGAGAVGKVADAASPLIKALAPAAGAVATAAAPAVAAAIPGLLAML